MNFLFGLQNSLLSVKDTIDFLLSHPFILASLFLYLLISLFYMLLLSKNPKKLLVMLTKDSGKSYELLAQKDVDGTYQDSFSTYQEQYAHIKSTFYISVLIFSIIIGASMLSLWG